MGSSGLWLTDSLEGGRERVRLTIMGQTSDWVLIFAKLKYGRIFLVSPSHRSFARIAFGPSFQGGLNFVEPTGSSLRMSQSMNPLLSVHPRQIYSPWWSSLHNGNADSPSSADRKGTAVIKLEHEREGALSLVCLPCLQVTEKHILNWSRALRKAR